MKETITYNNITFLDAQAMHLTHLKTFEAPTKEELEVLKPGDYVKVCVNNERFWVEIKSINEKIITGRIDNDLIQQQLKYNDILEFPYNCILSIGGF